MNVVNVDMFGYKVKDFVFFMEFFDVVILCSDGVNFVLINLMYFVDVSQQMMSICQVEDKFGKVSVFGNNVGFVQEMIKVSEVCQDYEFNVGFVKLLNKMMLMVVRR